MLNAGIEVYIGEQDGKILEKKIDDLDWFVFTSALPETHAELMMARKAGVRCTKRDDLTAYLVDELNLKMVAVAGTHGKTTTTAMIIWTALKLDLPVSYIVGTTLGFATSGSYHEGDKYFIYEADEYDRNFLKYHPWLSVIPAVSYDHPDIYHTPEEYFTAFAQFREQSERVVERLPSENRWAGVRDEIVQKIDDVELAGVARRVDAMLAAEAILTISEDIGRDDVDINRVLNILNDFPGVGRRFERLSDGIYSDYAHHPEEIEATIDVANDEAKRIKAKGVVVIYQPHQNVRQHEVRQGYAKAFDGADKVLWLPTYLTREDPNLPILTPNELSHGIANVEIVELSDKLYERIKELRNENYLVVLMTAGPADTWLREKVGV